MRSMLASLLCAVLIAACAGGPVRLPAAQARHASLVPGTIGLAVASERSAIVVVAVRADSAAARAGVREGDRIRRCDGALVADLREFERHVLDARPGTLLRLELRRGAEVHAVELPVEEILTAARA